MSQQEGVAAAIGTEPVEPAAMNPTAPAPSNETDEATLKAKLAAYEEQFNTLKSKKDSETAAERRARQEAEKRLADREVELAEKEAALARATDQHWQTFQKYAPKEDVEQALTAYQQEQAQRQQQAAQRAQWEAWKWRTGAQEGIPAAEIEAAKSQKAFEDIRSKYREEKLVASKEAEIEQRIIEKLKKEGVIAAPNPPPKTPLAVQSEPGAPKKKPTAEDVEQAREFFALHPRNKAAREAYEKVTAEFTAR